MISLKKFILPMSILLILSSLATAGDKHIVSNIITKEEVQKAQKSWADGLISIGQAYADKGNYKLAAKKMISSMYAYNYGKKIVMFKPTLASKNPFRPTKQGALSYFVGGNPSFKEDKGFALLRWQKVSYNNHQIFSYKGIAIAMGQARLENYKGDIVNVDYTLGFIKTKEGKLKLFLQHFSLPYEPHALVN